MGEICAWGDLFHNASILKQFLRDIQVHSVIVDNQDTRLGIHDFQTHCIISVG
jgi:hypothetical protein